MPRFAANLTMLWNELPFLDRFEAAAKAGFKAVEFLFPYDHPAETIAQVQGVRVFSPETARAVRKMLEMGELDIKAVSFLAVAE